MGPIARSPNPKPPPSQLISQTEFRSRISHPESLTLQKLYDFLRAHQALERAQEILSPLRLPEELTIKMMELQSDKRLV
jgi:hypothetical protein